MPYSGYVVAYPFDILVILRVITCNNPVSIESVLAQYFLLCFFFQIQSGLVYFSECVVSARCDPVDVIFIRYLSIKKPGLCTILTGVTRSSPI